MTDEETKNKPEEEVAIRLKKSEIFQLNLCVVARLSAAQMKFANAYCKEEQESAESLITYLTDLSAKLTGVLRNGKE